MQWLASLCVRQPVFTWVLMLVFVVIGVFGYSSLGVDQFPKIDFPAIVVTTHRERRRARRDRDRDHRQDRGRGQHDQRHRRAALDVERGRLARHHRLQPRQERRRRRAGGARPHQQRPARAAQGHRPAGRLQGRSRRRAHPARHADEPREPVRDITELADKRVRRQIESINGVGQVNILGGEKRQINVWLDPVAARGGGPHRGRRRSAPSRSRT